MLEFSHVSNLLSVRFITIMLGSFRDPGDLVARIGADVHPELDRQTADRPELDLKRHQIVVDAGKVLTLGKCRAARNGMDPDAQEDPAHWFGGRRSPPSRCGKIVLAMAMGPLGRAGWVG